MQGNMNILRVLDDGGTEWQMGMPLAESDFRFEGGEVKAGDDICDTSGKTYHVVRCQQCGTLHLRTEEGGGDCSQR